MSIRNAALRKEQDDLDTKVGRLGCNDNKVVLVGLAIGLLIVKTLLAILEELQLSRTEELQLSRT